MFKIINCWLGNHDWTSAHDEGLPIPSVNKEASLMLQFFEYAKMYCKNCGHVYHKSQEQIDAARTEESSRANSTE